MANPSLNPHEAIEAKELMIQQMIGIKQLSSSLQIVQDAELKNFIQDALTSKQYSLNELRTTLEAQLGKQ
ncbi:MAG: hypothetical protein GX895_10450 [Clostridiales bacterium]|uniref:hypothetical protein n=1 Tax=Clostridium sp. N3C TaxID=1776758 RepID=UPI00092DF078|nr:hypothetical protein [Clostridium sp. N3C]NLZ49182.1 hypothetical protein [Clostridiales bacterium]SCN25118.1 Spore coat protein [Clostridium sp. N3C]